MMRTTILRGVALGVLAALLAAGAAAQAAPRPAPPFTLELFDGTHLRLADLRGTAVILLFWAPW